MLMMQVNRKDAFTLKFKKENEPQVENSGSSLKSLGTFADPNSEVAILFVLCLASLWQLREQIISLRVCDLIYLRGYIYVLLLASLQYTFYSSEKLKEKRGGGV